MIIDIANNDIHKIIMSKESQQMAFAIIMLICLAPNGAVYPLILSEIPNIIRYIVIIAFVVSPIEMKSMILNELLFQKDDKSISILDKSCELLAFVSEIGLLFSILLQNHMSWSRILQGVMIVQYAIARVQLYYSAGGIQINQLLNIKGKASKTNKKKKAKKKV